MGSGMPEIGSRISLISKADIRYEGKLYSVDPEECTIALSSVRSYGTEDRQTGYPVPPQNQVYDYILFRGSDIKDIRVLSTTIPNDPAIVQLSVPPSMNDLQFQSQSGYPPPSIGSLTIPNVPGTSRQPPFQNAEFSIPTTSTSAQIPKTQPVSIPISEDESRSSTPSTQNATQKNAENRSQNAKPEDQNQTQRRQFGRDNRQVQQGQQGRYQQKQYSQQRYNQPQQQQQRYPQQRYQNQPRYMQPQYREYRDNQYRNYDYRDPYAPRQYVKWNNQNTRTGPPANQHQNYQSAGYPNRKPKNTLKFDVDFDFEQANSQFEEVKSKLSAIKIDDSDVKMNGDVESKKEDSGNEVSGEENEPEGDDKPIFYDKVKSFFDQISYEAIERSKGHTQRLDWKTERKINSETFGPVALRRNSNFRGRPGGNFYNNYQGRNTSIANNYRGSYRQQGQNRRPQYTHQVAKNHDDSRGNQSA